MENKKIELTIVEGAKIGARFVFDSIECPIKLGRSDECHVVFDPFKDTRASSLHAEIRYEDESFLVVDVGSANGTFVNTMKRINAQKLESGDVIIFGDGGPKVMVSLQKPAGIPVTEKLDDRSSKVPKTEVVTREVVLPSIALTRTDKKSDGGRYTFASDRSEISIGRGPGNDISFDEHEDVMVNHQHAVIIYKDGQYVLHDKESTNGSYRNGEWVTEARLEDGDTLSFGGPTGPTMRVAIEKPKKVLHSAQDRPTLPQVKPADQSLKQRSVGRTTIIGMMNQLFEERQRASYQKVKEEIQRYIDLIVKKRIRMAALILVALILVVAGGNAFYTYRATEGLRGDFVNRLEGVRSDMTAALEETNGTIRMLDSLVAQAATQTEVRAIRERVQVEEQRRVALEQSVRTTEQQIGEVREMAGAALRSFRNISDQVAASVYLVAIRRGSDILPFCSAFAVRSDGTLLTNAHCNEEFDSLMVAGDIPVVIRNQHPNEIYRVIRRVSHPGHSGNSLYDLAYLKLDTGGRAITSLQMASADELVELGPGSSVAVYGYPGRVMKLYQASSVAVLLPGTIGSIVQAAGVRLLNHTCPITRGTSGGALINAAGHVVGINFSFLGVETRVPVFKNGRPVIQNGSIVYENIAIPDPGLAYAVHGQIVAEYLNLVP